MKSRQSQGIGALRYEGICARRLKWLSGQAFAGMYDAAPTSSNASQFLRINGNNLVIDCKRCAAATQSCENLISTY